ncbi:MAG: hypothetical protein Q3997_00630 [Propionibacteriaceae bacterium]|nr:hypothetical protein [Propionibacteriaceae bacterium]
MAKPGSRYICPRDLEEFDVETARWVARGEPTGAPPRIRRMPRLEQWLKAWWDGDPSHLRVPDLAAAREHLAGDYHQVCPHGHPIPDDARRRATLPIALVGATSTGKSLYLAALYHEAVAAVRLGDYGLTFRASTSPGTNSAFWPTYDTLFGERRPVPATLPSQDGFSRPPLLLAPADRFEVPNLLLFDADGSKTRHAQAHVENNPALLRAQVFFIFVPPVNLADDGAWPGAPGQLDMDDVSNLARTMEAISGAIDALSRVHGTGQDLMACVLVSKADKLRGVVEPEMEEMLSDLDYRRFRFKEVVDYIDQDSAKIRSWIDRHQHGLVTLVEGFFGQVSYHFTSATGCSAVQEPDGGRRFPVIRPQRVLDPIIVALDRVGYKHG